MKAKVSRKAHFNAAHRLFVNHWSDEQNEKVFGLCSNPNYHGHNYELIVTVEGEINPITGFVIDMKELKELINNKIEKYLDHKNLNIEIPEFQKNIPTAEHIAVFIWNRLRPYIDEKLQLEVVLYETPRNFVTYQGK